MRLGPFLGFNLYSFPVISLDYSIYSDLLVCIVGKNLDQLTDNGSGKSSLAKALFWVFFGKSIYGGSQDKIASWGSEENGMFGSIKFGNNSGENWQYSVVRFRDFTPTEEQKAKIGDDVLLKEIRDRKGSGILFYVNGELFQGKEKTEKIDAQDFIEKSTQMTPNLFKTTIYTYQGSKQNLLNCNDSEAKKILTDLSDKAEYSRAFGLIGKAIEKRTEQLNEACSSASILSGMKNESQDAFNTNSAKSEEFEKVRTETLNTLNSELDKITKDFSEELITKKKKDISEKELLLNEVQKNGVDVANLRSQLVTLEEEAKLFTTSYDSSKLSEITEKETREISSKSLTVEATEKSIFDEVDALKERDELVEKVSALKTSEARIRSGYESRVKEVEKLESKTAYVYSLSDLDKVSAQIQKVLSEKTCPYCGSDRKEDHEKQVASDMEEINQRIEEYRSLIVTKEDKKKLRFKHIQNQIDKVVPQGGQAALKFVNSATETLLSHISVVRNVVAENIVLQGEKVATRELLTPVTKELGELTTKLQAISDNLSSNAKNRDLLSKLRAEIDAHKKAIEQVAVLQEIKDIKESITQSEELVREANRLVACIQELKSELAVLEDGKKKAEDERTRIKAKIEAETNTKNQYKDIAESANKKLKMIQKQLDEKNAIVAEYRELNRFDMMARTAVSPTGIRSYMFDGILESLNQKANKILDRLYNGALRVRFSGGKTSEEGTDNKIVRDIYFNGRNLDYHDISGGEQNRCDLAVDIALIEIAEDRASSKFSTKFIDEAFQFIDSTGLHFVSSYLKEMARGRNGVFVVTHDKEFQNSINTKIYVVKKHDLSRIVTKEEFDAAS